MAAVEEKAKVWAPHPDGDGKIRATFLEIAVGQPIEVDGIARDSAWISYDEGELEGTTARVPYQSLRRREE